MINDYAYSTTFEDRKRSFFTTKKVNASYECSLHTTAEAGPLTLTAPIMTLEVEKRTKRIAGFAKEVFLMTFFPYPVAVKLIMNTEGSLSNGAEVVSMAAISVLLTPTISLAPLTFAIALILETGRIISYGATHTAIEIAGKKYYVKTKKYQQILHQTFQLEAKSRRASKKNCKKCTTDRQIFHLWNELAINSPEKVVEHLQAANNWNKAKNAMATAFATSNYALLQSLINFGMTPHLFVYQQSKAGYEFGSLFALLNKRLQGLRPPEEKDVQMFLCLRDLLSEEAKSTSVFELTVVRQLEENKRVDILHAMHLLTGTEIEVANRLINKRGIERFVSSYRHTELPLFQNSRPVKSANKT